MPLPNDTDRFVVNRANTGMWCVYDQRYVIDAMRFENALDAQWVCEALNIRDHAEVAVKRYETKVLADD